MTAAHNAQFYSPTTFRLHSLTLLLPYVSEVGPPALRRMLLKCIPSANVQSVRRMVDLMDKTSREVILSNQRDNEDASEKVGGGKDIMSILRA